MHAPPTEDEIAQVKARVSPREVHLVELVDGEEVFPFVMTRPNREEFGKYQTEVSEAGGDLKKRIGAIERAALAQIRWPARETCQQIFFDGPGLVLGFSEELNRLARVNVEVRSKKL